MKRNNRRAPKKDRRELLLQIAKDAGADVRTDQEKKHDEALAKHQAELDKITATIDNQIEAAALNKNLSVIIYKYPGGEQWGGAEYGLGLQQFVLEHCRQHYRDLDPREVSLGRTEVSRTRVDGEDMVGYTYSWGIQLSWRPQAT